MTWHVRPKLLFFFSALGGCASFPYMGLIYRQALNLSPEQVGIISGVTPLAAFLSCPLASLLADKTGHRVAILAVLNAVGSACLWLLAIPGVHFSAAFATVFAAAFFAAPANPLMDALVLDMLGSDKELYGQQRLFAAIACGITYSISMTAYSLSGTLFAALACQCFWVAIFINLLPFITRKEKGGEEGAVTESEADPLPPNSAREIPADVPDGYAWLFRFHSIVFFFAVAILGAAFAVIQCFLYIFVTEELHGQPLLLGIMGPCTILIELPFFFYAKQVLDVLGMQNAITLGSLAVGLRLYLYTLLSPGDGAWWILGIELLHGLSFSLLWTAAVRFANEMAPKSLSTTAQGFLNAASSGLGFAAGSLLGGWAYGTVGPIVMFKVSAAIASTSGIIFALVHPTPRPRPVSQIL